ncbi:MAG: arsinothricin resistance N-acetyltransferase ArsN1 family B [Burkholderiales bacterium]
MIRPATVLDAPAIAAIYNPYVAATTISFEEAPVSDREMAQRIKDVTVSLPWHVFESDGKIVGYAYAAPFRARSAFRLSVESSVYVSPDHARKGIGRQLYRKLIDDLRQRGMGVVIGGIALPNIASVALHESIGFEKVAHFKKVGRKFEQWIDLGYWELMMNDE